MSGRSDRRSTSNKNVTGSSEDRRRRRAWLVENWPADRDVVRVWYADGTDTIEAPVMDPDDWAELVRVYPRVLRAERVKACRCYRCGRLLVAETSDPRHKVSPDRIRPGCEGGTYRRENLRPACIDCQTRTGSALGHARRALTR